MQLYTIDTGFFKLDGGAMYGVVPKTMWQKLNPPDADNLCTWAMRCMLIELENKLILIDTGLGDKQSEKFFSHYQPHGEDSLHKSLAKHGFHADDVTDVILTHLHFDHCGGAVKRDKELLTTTFRNATYWSNEKHWNWATKPNAREKASFLSENILPIQESGQLQFLTEKQKLYDQIDFQYVYGHTESMMLPILKYKDVKIMYAADLLPSASHVPLPYVMAYDTRPLLTLEEKEAILNRCVSEKIWIYLEHDKDTEMILLTKDEKGKIVVAEKEKLSTFAPSNI